RGKEERERTTNDRGGTIAELVDGREQLNRCSLVGNVNAPGINCDILRRGRKSPDDREDGEPADIHRRVRCSKPYEGGDEPDLAKNDPARSATKPTEERQLDPINERRPEKLEGVAKADPRQDPDRCKVDLGVAEPGVQRSDEES